MNKLCNVASCWIYTHIGILLGAYPILHSSRIRVKQKKKQYYLYRSKLFVRVLVGCNKL
jgi:hypothetical protein